MDTVGRDRQVTRALQLVFTNTLVTYGHTSSTGSVGPAGYRLNLLFRHIEDRAHNMVCLPPSMFDEANQIQRVQGAHKPRLHVHLPLFLVRTAALASVQRQLTPLALDDLRERVVPVIYVDHAARFKIPAEENARVREFPYGQPLRRWVVTRCRKETLRLKKRGNDAGARSRVEHLRQQSQ